MKTLRLVRNVAALFILLVALLPYPPSEAQTHGKSCVTKIGFYCYSDSTVKCAEDRCHKNDFCMNSGCM
jgi:hypothetical protein